VAGYGLDKLPYVGEGQKGAQSAQQQGKISKAQEEEVGIRGWGLARLTMRSLKRNNRKKVEMKPDKQDWNKDKRTGGNSPKIIEWGLAGYRG